MNGQPPAKDLENGLGSLDVSWLNSTPDPFVGRTLEIRRGRHSRSVSEGSAIPSAGLVSSEIQAPGPVADLSPLMAMLPSGQGPSGFAPALGSIPGEGTMAEMMREGMAAVFGIARRLGFPNVNVYQADLGESNQRTDDISTEEMLRVVTQRTAAVFDGRTALEYAIGHIPGALSAAPKPETPMSLYVSDVAEIAREVPDRAAAIVIYCNGPFCGKSRRLGDELVAAGFTNVRRYQLGTPVWRALVGPMQIEPAGISYIYGRDQTAVFLDARSPSEFSMGSFPGARNVPVGDIVTAKDDGRLPMDDFNTRVVTFGSDGAQALELAQALAGNGFNNVKFYSDTFSGLIALALSGTSLS